MRLVRGSLSLLAVATFVVSPQNALADDKKTCVDAYVAAQSRRTEHRLLAARTQLRICARQECASLMQGQMNRDCTQWLTDVEASIPTVVFSAKDAAGNDLQDVTVSADGAVVARKLDGHAMEIEPGSHNFTFVDAGGHADTQTVVVLEGTKNQVVHATFGQPAAPEPAPAPAPTPTPTTPAPPQPAPQSTAASPPPAPEPTPEANPEAASGYWTGQRIAGVAIAGAGLLGMGVGGIVALSAKSQFNTAQGESGQQRVTDSQAAYNQGNVASVVVGVGAAVAAAGIVVWLIAPSPDTQVGLGAHGMTLRGRF